MKWAIDTTWFDMNLLEEFECEEDLASYLQCKFWCAELCDRIVRAIDEKLSINDE